MFVFLLLNVLSNGNNVFTSNGKKKTGYGTHFAVPNHILLATFKISLLAAILLEMRTLRSTGLLTSSSVHDCCSFHYYL